MLTVFLIIGLGNPGVSYAKTNHNMGFQCVDYLASELNFPGFKLWFDSLYSELVIENCKVILIKPQTYMNLSGTAVQKFVQYYKIDLKNIVVIHDDLDLQPGVIKIKCGGSSGGHNGIKNIDNAIGTDYWRIRLGIGRPDNKNISINDYVLSKISVELNEKLPTVFKAISANIVSFLNEPVPKTQSIANLKSDAKL